MNVAYKSIVCYAHACFLKIIEKGMKMAGHSTEADTLYMHYSVHCMAVLYYT